MKRISDEEIWEIYENGIKRMMAGEDLGEGNVPNERRIAQTQLESCEKEAQERVQEIFGEMELSQSFDSSVVNSKTGRRAITMSFSEWQALKQKWGVK